MRCRTAISVEQLTMSPALGASATWSRSVSTCCSVVVRATACGSRRTPPRRVMPSLDAFFAMMAASRSDILWTPAAQTTARSAALTSWMSWTLRFPRSEALLAERSTSGAPPQSAFWRQRPGLWRRWDRRRRHLPIASCLAPSWRRSGRRSSTAGTRGGSRRWSCPCTRTAGMSSGIAAAALGATRSEALCESGFGFSSTTSKAKTATTTA
mmetsp:Transcript_24486/g.70310  ORF Transcript_24486/g.70310 Transcript_24486/m.70310 type:complete len:211 (+) Transcript_24486:841-1473(+)